MNRDMHLMPAYQKLHVGHQDNLIQDSRIHHGGHGGFGHHGGFGYHGGFGHYGGFGRPYGYGYGLPFLGGLAAGALLTAPYGYGYGYGYPYYGYPYPYYY